MSTEYRSSYLGTEIDAAIGKITALGSYNPISSEDILFFDGDYTGATDEVANLETFINANPGKTIHLRSGTLKFSRALNPAGGQNLLLKGQGRFASKIKYPSTSQAIYTTNHRTWHRDNASATNGQLSVTSITSETAPDLEPTTGTLTFTQNPSNGETVTIGYKTYTFQTTLTNTANNVKIGSTLAETITNLAAAINAGSGSGTSYAALTKQHGNVSATANATTLVVASGYGLLSTTETCANASWGSSTMTRVYASGGSTDSDQTHVLNVAVDTAYNIRYGDIVCVNSANFHPATSEDIRIGESIKVRWCDPATGKIYLSGRLAHDPATYYTSTVTVTKLDDTYRCEISEIGFEPDGDGSDYTVNGPSGRHVHCIDLFGYPYAHIHHCRGENLWEGFINIDVCPFSVIENNFTLHLVNMMTANTITNSGRLGYGVAVGNMSCYSVIRDNEFHEGRHPITSVHHSISSGYAGDDWWNAGATSRVYILNNRSINCYGVCWDTHESANEWVFEGNISSWVGRGPQHGSYVAHFGQDRGSNTRWIRNSQYGGQNGIRVTNNERLANAVHVFRDNRIENLFSSSDTLPTVANSNLTGGSTRNTALYVDSMYGITNRPEIEIDGLTVINANTAFAAFGGPLTVRASRIKARRCGVPIELFGEVDFTHDDQPFFDFQGTTRTPSALACVRMLSIDDQRRPMATGAKARFLSGAHIMKNSATKPTSFFLDEGVTGGSGCTLTFTTTNNGGVYSVNGTPTIAAGGAGYAVGELFRVPGTGYAASFEVTSVSGGAVTGIEVAFEGAYTVDPAGTGVATSGITTAKTYYMPNLREYNNGGVTKTALFASGASSRFTKSTAVNVLSGDDLTTYDNGTISSGTLTPDSSYGQMQKYTNNGAHTLAPPATDTVITLQMTNGASAGAITHSGFTKVAGDSLTTTNGDDFRLDIWKSGSFSQLNVTALQ